MEKWQENRNYRKIRDENGNIMDKDTKGRPRNGGC